MSEFLDEMKSCIPALRRYARAVTGNRDSADDLVQDALERAIRKKHLWSPSGSLQSWLFTLLINLYRNDLRREKRRPFLMPIEDMAADPAAPPEQHGRLALADMQRAFARLEDDHKDVILLVAVEGFSYKEAAAILAIPQGTLMSRLGRARANLKRFMHEGPPTISKQPLRSVK